MMKSYFTIAIVTVSEIVSRGLQSMLSEMRAINVRTIIVAPGDAYDVILDNRPTVVVVDPMAMSIGQIDSVKSQLKTAVFAIGSTASMPDEYLKSIDGVIGIYDSVERIMQQLKLQLKSDVAGDTVLTPREQEIVIGVVKGLSNKEIAAEMNLAVNTVMTHRRNIAAKLQIHSPAGLTIYALMNKLVSLEDVAKKL